MTQYEELVDEPVWCPVCNEEAYALGTLGNREHFRCRYCGAEFSREIQ